MGCNACPPARRRRHPGAHRWPERGAAAGGASRHHDAKPARWRAIGRAGRAKGRRHAGGWGELPAGLAPLAGLHRGRAARGLRCPARRRSLAARRCPAAILSDDAARRGEAGFPAGTLPLARDRDGLLAQRERDVAAACARAGVLARGLKTPIQLLPAEADRSAASGQRGAAAAVGGSAETMRRRVERALAEPCGRFAVPRAQRAACDDGRPRPARRRDQSRPADGRLTLVAGRPSATGKHDLRARRDAMPSRTSRRSSTPGPQGALPQCPGFQLAENPITHRGLASSR